MFFLFVFLCFVQNLVLIPNHQRALTKKVWSHCSKTVNVICSPLREQYLADALQRGVDGDGDGDGGDVMVNEGNVDGAETVAASTAGAESMLDALSPNLAEKKEDEASDDEEHHSLMIDSDDEERSTTMQLEGDDGDDDDEGDAFYRERQIKACSLCILQPLFRAKCFEIIAGKRLSFFLKGFLW